MDTPTLTKMGIQNPSEISRYAMSQINAQMDELTIYYKRQKGSLLPVRRTYQFGRALRTAMADGGTSRTAAVADISPRLLEAVAELDALLGGKESYEERKEALAGEMKELRRIVAEKAGDSDLNKRLDAFEASLRSL
jgi:Protein of unknown function (DUF3461)